MKKWLPVVLVIVVLGMLGGCGARQWGTFKSFFDELDSAKDVGSVKAVLSGCDYESNTAEAAENFTFEGLSLADAQWGGHIYASIDDQITNIGATLRCGFEDGEAQETYYQEAANLLVKDCGQPSQGYFDDGREYLEWRWDDTSLRLSQEEGKVILGYMRFTLSE